MSVANPFQYEDPNKVDAITGIPTATTCSAVVITIDDPAVTPVTFVCNGVTYTSGVEITMTAIGTDRDTIDQICWTGKVSITGLSEFTQYMWVVSQGSNSNNGSFYSAPSATDDFRILQTNCDVCAAPTAYTGGQPQFELDHPAFVYGIWPHYREIAEQTDVPTTVMLVLDDYGYMDRLKVDDEGGNTGFRNYYTPEANHTGSAYADSTLAWLCVLGFCGTTTPANDTGMMLWGRQVDRAWIRRNTSFVFQWGDHELKNDFGFDSPASDNPTATLLHATYDETGVGQFDGAAKVTFDAIFGHIRPPLSGVAAPSTVSDHWSTQYGCTTLAAPDILSQGTGGMDTFNPCVSDSGRQLGDDQIDDLLESIETIGSDFTILGMCTGLRYHLDLTSGYPVSGHVSTNAGDQQTLYDHSRLDYERLFTDTTTSLMALDKCNGSRGNMIVLHGDYHRPHAYRFYGEQGDLDEKFYMFGAGTTNGMSNVGLSTALIDRTAAKIEELYDSGFEYEETRYHGLYTTIYGSKSTSRMDVHMIDESGSVVWSGKTFSGYGNRFYDIDEVMCNVSSSAGIETTVVTL